MRAHGSLITHASARCACAHAALSHTVAYSRRRTAGDGDLDLIVLNTGTSVPNELFVNTDGVLSPELDAPFIWAGGTVEHVSAVDFDGKQPGVESV